MKLITRRALLMQGSRVGASVGLAMLAGCGAPTVNAPAPTRVYRIGWLSAAAAVVTDPDSRYPEIRRALRDLGYVEGENFLVEFRSAAGGPERLAEYAQELVDLRVDLILAGTSGPALEAKRATSTIPIVFHGLNDPVGLGIVPTLAGHGGNITGVAGPGAKLEPKRLEVFKEAVPTLATVALLFNGTDAGQRGRAVAAQDVAKELGISVRPIPTNTPADLDRAVELITQERPDGLMDSNPTTLYGGRALPHLGKRLLEPLVELRLPHLVGGLGAVRAGALMGLDVDADVGGRAVARLVDKILKGANPGDLPVEENTVMNLAVNLTMARKIGLTFPESVLRRAKEVIQ